MRTGWADNPRLQELVQRTDPGAHLIAEVVTVNGSDVKDLQSEWSDGTIAGGSVSFPISGGARLADGTVAAITQNSDDGAEVAGLSPLPVFDAILIEWTGTDPEEREIKNLVARLHPRPDGGEDKTVAEWRAQVFRVSERGPEDDRMVVWPISREVVVAAAGESVGDITFDFWDGFAYPVVGPAPKYHDDYDAARATKPLTVIRVIALTSTGAPATNVAWMADSSLTGIIAGSGYRVTHFDFREPDTAEGNETGGAVWSTNSVVGNMPRFTLSAPTYVAASVTFDGANAIIDLPGDGDLEIIANGRTPFGSSLTYRIWNGSAYIECKSGDLVGVDNSATGGSDLSGVSTTGPWLLQVALTPSANNRNTPTVREFGIRRVVTTELAGLATISGGRSKIDPISLKGNIPKAEITILKTGARDFRDYGTTILAENHIGDIEVRLWIGEPSGLLLDRSEWMHHSTWEVEDYRNDQAGHVLECVSPIRRLRTQIPQFVQTGGNDGTRTKIEYSNRSPKYVWDDIVDGRVGLPGRFRGPGIEDAVSTMSKVIEETDAKDELDRVAYLAGYANIESQGKIRAVPVMRDGVGAGTPVAFFPIGSYNPKYIGPGFKSRTDEFFVPLDWDEDSQSFEAEVRKFNATAFTKLGGAGLNTTQKLEAETAKWIDTDAMAIAVAERVPQHFGNGLIVWELEPIYLHPHLEVGDVVVVETNQFVARSPITDREIRGPVATLALVVDNHGDAWGRHLSVWVPGFDGIVTSEGDITWLNFKKPKIEEGVVIFNADGSANFQGRTTETGAVRAAHAAALPFPNTAAVDAASLEAVDADGYFDYEIAAAGTYALGDTIYVSSHAYENADGTGSRSTPIFKASRERSSTEVTGKIWVEVDTAAQTLDVNADAEGSSTLFPATLTLYQDDPTGAAIDLDGLGATEHSFTNSGDTIGPTGSGATTEYSGLTDLPLPKTGALRFFGLLTAASGAVTWLFSMGDLDSLPGGSTTVDDYATAPVLRIAYDDDVPEIVLVTPSGNKTYTGLSGGGLVTYTVGTDILDNSSTESLLTDDETRAGYKVTLYGAASASGPSLDVFDGALHGVQAAEPNYLILTAAQWSVAGTIQSFKLYNWYVNVSPGPATLSMKVEYNDGTGAVSYADNLATPRRGLAESDGVTTAIWPNDQAAFDVTYTPYTGLDATGDAGTPVTLNTGATSVSGAGTSAESSGAAILSGNFLAMGPTFDAQARAADDEPELVLRATHAAGNQSGTWAPDFDDGGSQTATATGTLTVNVPANLPSGHSLLILLVTGSNTVTFSGYSGPRLSWDEGTLHLAIHNYDGTYSLTGAAS